MSPYSKARPLSHPSHRSPPSLPRKGAGENRVRIIGGHWRSRVIDFPESEGLRPTANRVRETLFNWLGQTLHDMRCLDLFAGSGALGFEAASRGATEVVMIEKSTATAAALKVNLQKLGAPPHGRVEIVQSNAEAYLARNKMPFDIVFCDPPFGTPLLDAALTTLHDHVSPEGVVYVEWGEPLENRFNASTENKWQVIKQSKAGAVHFGLLKQTSDFSLS